MASDDRVFDNDFPHALSRSCYSAKKHPPAVVANIIADALNPLHFIKRQGSLVQDGQGLAHLVDTLWPRHADIHVRVGQNEAVAVRTAQGSLSRRHFAGFRQFSPAGGRVGDQGRPARRLVLPRIRLSLKSMDNLR